MSANTERLTHAERCNRESTRDVIFLFQRRVRTFIYEPEGFRHDGDGWERVDDDGEVIDAESYVSDDDVAAADSECFVNTWITEGVWLDRGEAESYGKFHAYNYENPNKDVGWRVWGVPSYGELAKLLRAQDEAKEK